MNEVNPVTRARALNLLYLAFVIFFVLVVRLFYLQLVRHEFFMEKSFDQKLRIITLSPDRGDILDRNGNVLATSINSYSMYVFPALVKDKNTTAEIISRLLKQKRSVVMDKLNSNKPFVWIKRKIEEPVAQKLITKKLPGIGFLSEKKRVYPKKNLASQVLGFVGMDNQGLSGIELFYDRYLKGEEGMLITERDLRGRDILTSNLRELKKPTDGMDITLTIDEPIQYKAETEIKKAVQENNAKAGCIIVLDVKNGDVLALASYPDFDPNDYLKYRENVWYNRAVTDVYEPGSTFKLVTVASAIEDKVITKNSKVYCPDSIELGGRVIKNSHKLKFKTKYLSMEEILGESVNIGVVQIALKLGKERFYRSIKDFGFGGSTNVGLPGESRGILSELSLWNKPDIGMISFGQSIAVTPIQLISSLSTIANDGIRLKPRLVNKIESVDSSFLKIYATHPMGRIIASKTSRDVLDLCETVVERGTGKLAKIPGFRVGGKTGTAQKALPGGGGYMPGKFVASFIGFVPLFSPKIAVLVIVDEPKPYYWGERVAAPVFKRVAEYSLRRLNIPPDKKESSVI